MGGHGTSRGLAGRLGLWGETGEPCRVVVKKMRPEVRGSSETRVSRVGRHAGHGQLRKGHRLLEQLHFPVPHDEKPSQPPKAPALQTPV